MSEHKNVLIKGTTAGGLLKPVLCDSAGRIVILGGGGGGASIGTALPLATGAAAAGTSGLASAQDHVHPLGDLSANYPDQTLARLNLVLLQ